MRPTDTRKLQMCIHNKNVLNTKYYSVFIMCLIYSTISINQLIVMLVITPRSCECYSSILDQQFLILTFVDSKM